MLVWWEEWVFVWWEQCVFVWWEEWAFVWWEEWVFMGRVGVWLMERVGVCLLWRVCVCVFLLVTIPWRTADKHQYRHTTHTNINQTFQTQISLREHIRVHNSHNTAKKKHRNTPTETNRQITNTHNNINIDNRKYCLPAYIVEHTKQNQNL